MKARWPSILGSDLRLVEIRQSYIVLPRAMRMSDWCARWAYPKRVWLGRAP